MAEALTPSELRTAAERVVTVMQEFAADLEVWSEHFSGQDRGNVLAGAQADLEGAAKNLEGVPEAFELAASDDQEKESEDA